MTGEPSEPGARALVTAVVLTWNTPDLAIQTMVSLTGSYADGLRMVLVENGSVDDSPEVIQKFLEGWEYSASVTFVQSAENLGFGGGVNLGATHALAVVPPPDYIWLLNPDAVVNPGTVRELVAVARESGAGIVSAAEGGPGMAGLGRWPRPFYLRPHDFMVAADPGIQWVVTARCAAWCAIVDARAIDSLITRDGHFEDEGLFLDWDEWDLSLRAAGLGWRSVAALSAMAEHDTSGRTFGKSPMAAARQYYQSRNAITVTRRFLPWWRFWPIWSIRIVRDFTWFLRMRIQGVRMNERAYLLGLVDGMRGKSGKWAKHPPSPKSQ